ncbi:MAG TPA: hypothetical protein VNG33_17675, partial [Polyangiaceae bacterium]|nr:hypothetical protein [Polyangiaceae bacterium]
MMDLTLLFASAIAVASSAVAILYFPRRRGAFRVCLWCGLLALLIAAMAGTAIHLEPVDPSQLNLFGPDVLAILGSSLGANLVALAIVVLGMLG